jgi:hypothetical protein
VATEVTHSTHTFLAFEDDEHSPALAIPVAETLEELKRSPARRPPYVFFEIDQLTFDEETQDLPVPNTSSEVASASACARSVGADECESHCCDGTRVLALVRRKGRSIGGAQVLRAARVFT